ncbi:PREDICTED: EH domain-containing [Prunus dulcis]|uniref:PREDICTED: EH domain-containing n=1 Tax=Prunus dulcis TaxID=3755 RepID=A0A5E4FTJ0_PRUDU|nr:PREDICTED: EH domain-containing [Prunus dulcis]
MGPVSLCPKEYQKVYQEWFNLVDSDGDGRITGNEATKFFALSKLSRQELKQVFKFHFDIRLISIFHFSAFSL